MKFFTIPLLVALVAVAACSVDPQAAKQRRDALIDQVFPSEAEQKGIHLAFPVDTGMNIVYLPEEVSQQDVDRRMSGYCARIGHPETKISRPPEPSTATLADGSKRAATSVWYDCD